MFVKFTAKPDTWFKAGTEVLWEDSKWTTRRPTLEEYEQIKHAGMAVFRGIRITEPDNVNETQFYKPYEEYEDGELCLLEEFDIEGSQ